jgi:hypothetical protein
MTVMFAHVGHQIVVLKRMLCLFCNNYCCGYRGRGSDSRIGFYALV